MRLLLALVAAAGLAFAGSVQQHKVRLNDTYVVQEKVLEPGQYKVVIEGEHATIKKGKDEILKDVKVVTVPAKFNYTAVGSRTENGKRELTEIQIGGTRQKLVFVES